MSDARVFIASCRPLVIAKERLPEVIRGWNDPRTALRPATCKMSREPLGMSVNLLKTVSVNKAPLGTAV
jgi:hypothetical protein